MCAKIQQKKTLSFPHLVRDRPQPGVVPVPRVGRPAADDHLGSEVAGLVLELVVVDPARRRVELVRQRLEEDRRRRDLLAVSRVVPVGQVAARRQVEAHDAVVRVEQRGVDREVGRGARVGLHVDAPGARVEVEGAQRALLAEELEAVDVLVSSVVAGVGLALWLRLGVEVVEGGGGGGGLVVVCGGETS